jgi:hypothetical protein
MTKIISNREFLRDYRHWRMKLENGSLDKLEIPQKNGVVLKIVVERKMTPFQRLLEKVALKPFQSLKRPEEDIL